MSDAKEILVISGAGSAGISTAISAARKGHPVVLVEKSSAIGGTVTKSLIHTLGGIFSSSGEFINNGIIVELANRLFKSDPFAKKRKIGRTWTLQCSPEIYGRVVEEWIKEESNIKLMLNSEICGAEVSIDHQNAIPSIQSITVRSGDRRLDAGVIALIDTTGSGSVIRLIDPCLANDSEPKPAAGFIFILKDVESEALNFPGNIKYLHGIRDAVKKGILPVECAETWIDQGVYEGECYVKMTVSVQSGQLDPDNQAGRTSVRTLNKIRDELMAFLRTMPAFSKAYLYKTGDLGLRDGGRIIGEYCLTQADIMEARKFDDAACRCSWPIEYWDPEKGVTIAYLEDNAFYEIPLRALKVRNIRNAWAAGKCFSGDSKARASARVVGCCWSMGEAVADGIHKNL
ncbi:MAG: FAD-dependent oxidoreductase [bacterium]